MGLFSLNIMGLRRAESELEGFTLSPFSLTTEEWQLDQSRNGVDLESLLFSQLHQMGVQGPITRSF